MRHRHSRLRSGRKRACHTITSGVVDGSSLLAGGLDRRGLWQLISGGPFISEQVLRLPTPTTQRLAASNWARLTQQLHTLARFASPDKIHCLLRRPSPNHTPRSQQAQSQSRVWQRLLRPPSPLTRRTAESQASKHAYKNDDVSLSPSDMNSDRDRSATPHRDAFAARSSNSTVAEASSASTDVLASGEDSRISHHIDKKRS